MAIGEYIDSNGKAFGIVAPRAKKDELKKVIRELGVQNYKPMEH